MVQQLRTSPCTCHFKSCFWVGKTVTAAEMILSVSDFSCVVNSDFYWKHTVVIPQLWRNGATVFSFNSIKICSLQKTFLIN